MKLVHDWKSAWRWFSVRLLALIAVVPIVWSELPHDVKDYIPEEWRPFVVAGMALLAIVGRLIDQEDA